MGRIEITYSSIGRRALRAALAMAVTIAPLTAGIARADVYPDSIVQVGPWQLRAQTRGTNPAFEQCGIRRIYGDGLILHLGHAYSGSRGMFAEVPAWGLKVGETYPATFTIGSQTFTFIGTARTTTGMTFLTAPEFFEQLRSDRSLQISANQRQFTVNLAGVEEATKRMDACVKEYTGRTLPAAQRAPASPIVDARRSAPGLANLTPLRPVYPEASRQAGEQGMVMLDVTVGVDGLPSIIAIQKSSGYPALDEAAVNAVKATRFQPYTANGTTQSVRIRIPIRFALGG